LGGKPNMKYKLLSWNVNGIRAAVGHGFEAFLKAAKPDILCLQEIKLDDVKREEAKFDFTAYEEYWYPAQRKGYSGTAVLLKEGLKPLSQKRGLGVAKFDDEGRVLTLEFAKFFLVNTYFPNSQPELQRLQFKQEFDAAWLKHIKKLEKTKPVVVCGDFNVAHEEIDIARPRDNEGTSGFTKEERGWFGKFIAGGLIDTWRHAHPTKVQYSWWTYRFGARSRNVGWRIDYWLVSAKLIKHVKKAFILDKIKGSDHCPVGIELDY
jgi:exodeoxyribonuclease-3